MIIAPIPPDETERLASLSKLNLLDTPLEERFERITRMACRLLNVPISGFNIIDAERQWFKSIQGMRGTETTRNTSFCAHTILVDDIMIVPNAVQDERFTDNPNVIDAPYIKFYAGCPVRSPDGRKIGSLCAIDVVPRQLNADELQVLRDLAGMIESELKLAAVSTTQGELIAKLDAAERLARIDALTRIWNRAGILDILKREWAEGLRQKKPVCIALADIDHFKKVNDTYGHPAGDAVLQDFAKNIMTSLRTEDAVGRYGGEEFLVVLPGCTPEKLFMTVDRIRQESTRLPSRTDKGEIAFTASFGAACLVPEKDKDMAALIQLADDRLYKAKHEGRDRTIAE